MSYQNSAIADEKGILKPDVVASDYFLLRVKAYERQYNRGWGDFFGEYESGRLDPDKRNRDYLEWAFLCRTFSSELIQMDAKGPPGEPSASAEKPENNSGFCFSAEMHVRCKGILRAGGQTPRLMPKGKN